MADRVESMSDAELRTKLAEHGFPVMPVTASTRKLLVKKLKVILENKSKPRNSISNKADNRKTLANYSSGEDSELDSTSSREKKGRRITTGGAMLPPTGSSRLRRPTPKKETPRRDSDKGSESDEEKTPIRTHEEVETVTTKRVTRTYAKPGDNDDYETGSDSDVDVDKKTTPPYRSSSRSSEYVSTTFPRSDSGLGSSTRTSIFSRPPLSSSNYSTTISSSDHLNSIRSRLGLTSSLGDKPSVSNYASNYSSSSYKPPISTISDEIESPYLNTFSKRLSSLKPETPKAGPYLDRDINNVKRNDITSIVDDQNSNIPICQLNIPSNKPGVNCVIKEQVNYAKDLLKILYPELAKKIAAFQCGKSGAVPYLTDREILDLACTRTDSVDLSQCRDDLNNLQVLIVNNPHWGLNVVHLKGLYSKDPDYSALTTMDELVRQRNKGYQKRKTEEVYSMVEQIIDVISQETEDSEEPYISVDHVRDTLISPQNREKMAAVWDAAVKFIQQNESRVRMEVQSVDGEDCRVWRWVSARLSPKRNAAWQGQAFETQEGSVNNVPIAPTPCLKIRHMFDKNDFNENLKTIIQDAILEKCGEPCNILHIDLDPISCCVYVKCASSSDAGVVYRNLHGWWYESRLITVKYLRLERYMQRFPNSPSSGPYLKPSRQKRSRDE
ncbi:Inner nuclear membrane protein Man1 [Eumeta japonica]|uniref:LEM domain-containing protein 2 n=1 Tax=Eumeta variegata TaxID=151549 RepID=A0A4C1YPB5_EUMVA|nr:Inner nuclear membrane protein Man1 [Eumeta japonica]